MILLEDKGQVEKKHQAKHDYWDSAEIDFIRVPLPVGDYILVNDKVQDVIDRKNGRVIKVIGKKTVKLKNGKEVERNIYECGVDLKKMDFVGTYDVCVDTKKDIEELIMDIIGRQHERFRDELIFAKNNNIKLYILVENKGGEIGHTGIFNKTVRSIDELFSWINPRLFIMKPSKEVIGYYKNGKPKYKRVQAYPNATKGQTLAKACITMQERYGCEFVFCTPEESGAKVIELLTKGGEKVG